VLVKACSSTLKQHQLIQAMCRHAIPVGVRTYKESETSTADNGVGSTALANLQSTTQAP
jgi:hypothetical protein